jgi:putative transposase
VNLLLRIVGLLGHSLPGDLWLCLDQVYGGSTPQLCREHGISSATFYKWRSKFGGMDASLMSQLKELQDENRRLKKMYADAQLSAELLKEAMAKKW